MNWQQVYTHLIDEHSKFVVYLLTLPVLWAAGYVLSDVKYSTFATAVVSLAIGFFVGKGVQEHAEAKFNGAPEAKP